MNELSKEFGVSTLLSYLGLNRSGYYKWIKRKGKPNRYQINRNDLTNHLQKEHEKHKSYGYHRLAITIRKDTGWFFSDLLAHKCAKAAGIKSKARCRHKKKPGKESIIYPNQILGWWNASRPLEIVVSDMTEVKNNGITYEWTYVLDTFNNEIIASALSSKKGDPKPYFQCLDQLKAKIKGAEKSTYLHTDQGTIYSSQEFTRAHKNYNIKRSMSRSGTPTDNPIIEAINGWVKAELYLDFNLKHSEYIHQTIEDYIQYFNNERPANALAYKTPLQYKLELGFT